MPTSFRSWKSEHPATILWRKLGRFNSPVYIYVSMTARNVWHIVQITAISTPFPGLSLILHHRPHKKCHTKYYKIRCIDSNIPFARGKTAQYNHVPTTWTRDRKFEYLILTEQDVLNEYLVDLF